MKLQLSHEKGVEILSVVGPIASHDTRVLGAGIAKILRTGKNRIILEMPDSQDLAPEVIRELAAFDGLARELSGRIVLAKVTPGLKTKIESFAKPPVIVCFENRGKAMEFLTAPPVQELPPASPAASGELELLKAEESALRARIKSLETEVQRLREQLVLATIARRPPANEADYTARIRHLEDKLDKTLSEPGGGPEKGSEKGKKT